MITLIANWAGYLLLALSLYLIGFNFWCLVRAIAHKPAPSWIPLVAGIPGTIAIACGITPLGRNLWWIPIVVDPGGVFYLFGVSLHLLQDRDRKVKKTDQ